MTYKCKLDVDAGFDLLDVDGSGTITFDELIDAFKNGKFQNWIKKMISKLLKIFKKTINIEITHFRSFEFNQM